MSGAVVAATSDGVTRVRLARPEKRNALTPAMLSAIADAVATADREASAVIVLSGEPGFFSAGADIALYGDIATDAGTLLEFTELAKSVCSSLAASRAIVVAEVDGVAMGGGFELILSSDLVIASDRSRFALPEISLGLIPGWGGTQRLARLLGANRAREAVLLGTVFGAERAHELGIVTAVTSSDDLSSTVDDTVRALLARAPLALAAGKRAVAAATDPGLGTGAGDRLETELLMSLFASDDGREGVRAFVEKRAARFVGR